jgi:hypothetical protein
LVLLPDPPLAPAPLALPLVVVEPVAALPLALPLVSLPLATVPLAAPLPLRVPPVALPLLPLAPLPLLPPLEDELSLLPPHAATRMAKTNAHVSVGGRWGMDNPRMQARCLVL